MGRDDQVPAAAGDSIRLDRWLWAARFFKTRGQAAEAIDGGKVDVNGDRAKRARPVRAGDEVRIRIPPYEWIVEVLVPGAHRGRAADAALLYAERPDSLEARTRLRAQVKAMPRPPAGTRGKPSKKDRRLMDKWRRP